MHRDDSGPPAPPDGSASAPFLTGGGKMGERLRAFEWSSHPLGPPERWPQCLRTAVGICLNSRFPMFVWWGPELFNIYNDAYAPMLGQRHPAALGRRARDAWDDIWSVVGPQAESVMTRGEATWNERVRLVMERHGYSEDTWFTWSYSPIHGDDGNVAGLFCAVTEETQRVRAEAERDRLEAALRRNEDRYRSFIRFSSEAIWRFELEDPIPTDLPADEQIALMFRRGYLAECNDVMARMYGFAAASEIVGRRLPEFQDPADPRSVEFLRAFIHSRYRLTDAESTEPDRDGQLRTFRNSFVGIVEGGALVRAWGMQRDVTDQRKAEAALRDAEQRYRAVFESTRDAIIVYTPEGKIVEVNPAACRIYGFAREQFVGIHAPSAVHPDALPHFNEFLRVAAAGGEFRCETVDRRSDGTEFPIEVVGGSFNFNGQSLLMAVVRDITERRRATDRLSRLHAVAAALSEALTTDDVAGVAVEQGLGAFGASAGSLCVLSGDGTMLEMLRSAGYPAEIIAPWQSFPMDAQIPLCDAVRNAEPIYFESPEERLRRYPALAAVRASKATQASACIPLLVGAKAIGVIGLSFDRPGPFAPEDRAFMLSLGRQCAQALERARLFEAERRARAEAERASEAKSEFLATLSHEMRTPLTPVLLTVSLMESHPALPEDLREDVATIRRNVELESRLISDLLDLTRITRGKLQLDEQDVDLHLILRSAVDICQREASARMVVDLRATLHVVRGDSTRLQQIFWNLINNAHKFTGPEGTVTVRSSDAPGGRVRVEVIDTGAGIDPQVLPKLFNAFEQGDVRAARRQAGLGLGLAISKRLAESHGGTIAAASEGRGRGATFTVELPALSEFVPEAAPPRPTAPEPAVTPLNVLLVEDHDATLSALVKLLRILGHRVTGVTTVASATAAARQNGYDLIISDLGLPDGSGLDVMRQLRDRYAGRAIALTGYGMDADIAASREAGFTEHLTKPVDLAKLQNAIRRVTSERPSD